MKYTPNDRLREISQMLSPERWQELQAYAFSRGGCVKPSKDEDQNLALVAMALALELPVGMDLWGQLKTMAEFVEQCHVYAYNARRAKSLQKYEAYISAIPDSGKREPHHSVLENMWMLHPNWNGLLLRQFESDKETEMLKAELLEELKPVDKFAAERKAWEADNRDYHDAHKAWTVCFSDGGTITATNTGPLWDARRQYKRNEERVRSLPLKHRGVVGRAYLVEAGLYTVREVATTYLNQGFFDLKLVYRTREAAVAAKDGVVKALKDR